MFGVDEAAVLSDPAEARGRGERPLGEGRGVDADPGAPRVAEPRSGGRDHGESLRSEAAVVIGSPGVAGEARAVLGDPGRGGVGRGEADDGARSGQQRSRVRADVPGLLEVSHPGVPSGGEPVGEERVSRRLLRPRDAESDEAGALRLFAEHPRREEPVGRRRIVLRQAARC